MVRVIIKGGDEILKAAIMKYGKNQWSRIASLLHRKSSKQCKARWYEWLDPGIKKTEWSREEDEKLLHLAKLMPTQWRTIAPIVGRTAAQCLERYEHLLDEAQRKAEGIEDDVEEAKKLRPGEIDPTPETKPARPDPIDMDEDELEMLSEARARLANTQGKKAKRKAREKQLSEARRLASLQKRRELRAAGIAWGNYRFTRRNPTHIDYSAEIPFEKEVPAGFHDPSEDKYEKDTAFERKSRAELDGPRRDDAEYHARRKDRDKLKKRRATEEPESIFNKPSEKKRSKLVLPQPQISDVDIEQIVKIGHASDTARSMADAQASSGLLSDYSMGAQPAALRTPRTPAVHNDFISQEAENLLTLQNLQTPLKGGENPTLRDDRQLGSVRAPVTATPNTVLATPQSIRNNESGATPSAATPSSVIAPAATAGATPFRDRLNINEPDTSVADARSRVRDALGQLPTPKNDYEIVVPEDEEATVGQEEREDTDWTEDAAELDEERARQRARTRQAEFKRQSSVFQRDLPRPSQVNQAALKAPPTRSVDAIQRADEMIKSEMLNMLKHDVDGEELDTDLSLDELKQARELVTSETMGTPAPDVEQLSAVWEECYDQLVFSHGRFTRSTVVPRKERVEAFSQQLEMYREWMARQAKKSAKLEKKMKVKLAGYQSIAQNLQSQLDNVRSQCDVTAMEVDTFEALADHERQAAPRRIAALSEAVRQQEIRERGLQECYAELASERVDLMQIHVREQATISAAPSLNLIEE